MCNRSFNITSHVCSIFHRHVTFLIHILLFTSLHVNILLKYIFRYVFFLLFILCQFILCKCLNVNGGKVMFETKMFCCVMVGHDRCLQGITQHKSIHNSI